MLPEMAFTSFVRTALFTALVLVAAALPPTVAKAQTLPAIPAPSETVYEIRLADAPWSLRASWNSMRNRWFS